VNKKSKQNAESLHGIGSDIMAEWLLKNRDKLPTLDEITRTLKKRPKRTEDDRDLKKKIAELFRSVGDEKRAKRIEASRDVGRAFGELIRVMNTETNPKRAADLAKKFAELVEDRERSRRAAAGGDLEKTIAELFRAIEELKSSRPVSHATLDRARELAESWHSEFGNSNLLIVLLAGLVTAQNRKIERLDKLRQLFSGPPAERKLSANQRYERGRRYVPAVGEIEWEFGGVRPPGTSDMNDSAMNRLKPPEPPTCFDNIFAGHAVNMKGLIMLFGRDRHLLAKLARVPIKKGRETLYDYRAVKDIMDALLSKKRRKRKSSARRRPPRERWLSDPPHAPDWRPVNAFWRVRHYCRSVRGTVREPLRTRVLTGIEARINGLSERVPKHIKSEFLAVIHRHLIDTGKK
jgi:hypothetical protein